MEQEIHITLRYNLAIGKVNLNEIVYELQQLRDPLMLEILKQILRHYDDLISERLSTVQSNPPSKARKGLGQHVRKGDEKDRFCHGRRVRKRGYRNHPEASHLFLENSNCLCVWSNVVHVEADIVRCYVHLK